tara:strand:- start:285 stop:434 length:150 start_codon:yes stop_codon:yes gene_type:complete
MTEQQKKNALSLIWDVLQCRMEEFEDGEWDKMRRYIIEELGLDSGENNA